MKFIFPILLVLAISATAQEPNCDRTVTGRILDIDSKQPLPYATIKIVDTENGAIAKEDGTFVLQNVCNEEIHLEVRFVGYKTIIHHHDVHHSSPTIYLAPEEGLLESVIVEESRTEKLKSLSVQKKELNELSILNTSLDGMAEELSGVSMLKTGANISKPIIHGLHSNRVLVINNGIRHAYQVWGLEHAPEIDPSNVDQIEVVKGAATVKYGPEALGGVILYNSKRPVFDQKITGSVGGGHQTNGRSASGQVSIGHGLHRFAWNAGAFGIYQGDLETPDYNLSNTGKREYGGSFNTLLHQPKFDLQVSGSYFKQDLGILRASIVGNLDDLQGAINDSIPEPTFDPTYDLQNPRQDTEHRMLKTEFTYFAGEHIFNLQYAIQRNVRKEFDIRRGELNDRPVIDLELVSHSLEIDWTQPAKGNWSGNSGIQLYTQKSINEPESNPVNFVPDYDVLNVGAFTVQSLDFDDATIELGARVDYQKLSVIDTIRDVFIYDNEVDFTNGTVTLGVRKQFNQYLSLYSNIGTAWRPPNVAELYSFGYHFSRLQYGLWRYDLNPTITTPVDSVFDQTLRPVPAEKSIKWITGVEIRKEKTNAEFVVYANRINDYIFLRPYGITTGIAGTFPFFIYDQTDALFLGSDWDIRYNHTPEISSEIKISYVYAIERGENQPFIETPPLNIDYELGYSHSYWKYGLQLNYTAEQWLAPPVINPEDFQNGTAELNLGEIFDFMPPPDGYLLVGATVGYERKSWNAEVRVHNMFNTSYRIYTDRLRYFSNAPGRNFSFAVAYKF